MHKFTIDNTTYDRRHLTLLASKSLSANSINLGLFKYNNKIFKYVYKNVNNKYFYVEEHLESIKFKEISEQQANELIVELTDNSVAQNNYLDKFPKEDKQDYNKRL